MRGTERRPAARPAITLAFRAADGEVRDALVQVDAALARLGIDADLRQRAQITLAEACNNIVEHAYLPACAAEDRMVALEITLRADGLLVLLRDNGRPMPGGRLPGAAMPRVDAADPMGLPEGGFGWPLLRRMAVGLSLSRQAGRNTLRFRLPARPDAGTEE